MTEIKVTEEVVGVDDMNDEDFEEKFRIFEHPKVVKDVSIYLSEHVENNFAYVELMNKLRRYSKQTRISLYLANYGGSCSTGFQLFNAIKTTKAHVDVIVDAPCYSMGAILALSGKTLHMNPGTFLMFHNYSSYDRGKGTELHTAVTHYHQYFHQYLKEICAPFLTAKELERLRNDNDVYISYSDEDLEKRIKRHFKGK